MYISIGLSHISHVGVGVGACVRVLVRVCRHSHWEWKSLLPSTECTVMKRVFTSALSAVCSGSGINKWSMLQYLSWSHRTCPEAGNWMVAVSIHTEWDSPSVVMTEGSRHATLSCNRLLPAVLRRCNFIYPDRIYVRQSREFEIITWNAELVMRAKTTISTYVFQR